MENQPVEVNKDASKEVKQLTPKNRLFLMLLSEGKSTIEAYRAAGYKGEDHAAYELRSYLKEELLKILEGKGISREGLLMEYARMKDLPLNQDTINVREKMDILAKMSKLLPSADADSKPKITAFIIKPAEPKQEPIQVIEVSPIENRTEQI